jgi:hypothetical protein
MRHRIFGGQSRSNGLPTCLDERLRWSTASGGIMGDEFSPAQLAALSHPFGGEGCPTRPACGMRPPRAEAQFLPVMSMSKQRKALAARSCMPRLAHRSARMRRCCSPGWRRRALRWVEPASRRLSPAPADDAGRNQTNWNWRLGFGRPALFSMRAQFELVLAWIYFNDHPVEWRQFETQGEDFPLRAALIKYINGSDCGSSKPDPARVHTVHRCCGHDAPELVVDFVSEEHLRNSYWRSP